MAAVVGVALMAGGGSARAGDGLFGSREVRSVRMAPFTKWLGMLKRFEQHANAVDTPCTISRFRRCYFQSWSKFITDIGDNDRRQQLAAVNTRMNASPYITDPRNWGLKDYWETPGEFFRKDGDCEDYAIVKYMTLKALGFDPASMRIVVVQDINLKVPHAVLAVELEGESWILDNQARSVVKATSVHHYRPIYSINENAWWLHKL